MYSIVYYNIIQYISGVILTILYYFILESNTGIIKIPGIKYSLC